MAQRSVTESPRGGLAYYPDLKWSIRVDWDIDGDAESWYELLDLAGYDMPGVLWTHTPGPTGEADFSTNLRERTSNYFSGWYGTVTGTGALASGQVQASVEGLSFLAQVSGVPRARGVYYRDMSSGGSVGLCF